jgi:hypothetical protein
LSWIKILPFINGKLGGWVAENYLAMSRIMGWFFELIDLLPEPEPYVDPDIDVSKFVKKQSIAWLKSRDLDIKGSSIELKKRIIQYMQMDDVPQIVVKKICSAEIVIKTVKSLQQVIHYCMTLIGSPNDQLLISSLVRVFLTNYSEFEESIYNNPIPRWLTSYNFLSLLNLPKVIDNYTSLRYLWEGKQHGEGYLRSVKS